MLRVERLSKSFGDLSVLRDVSFEVPRGKFAVVLGRSGAGKSTLMRCINRLEEPTAGKVSIDGLEAAHTPGELRELRRRVGMIFQHYNVVKRVTVLTNVLHGRIAYVPRWASLLHLFPARDVEIAYECIRRVDLEDKIWARTDTLSGGQQQRVGIARALAQQPKVILADEPVSSLDPRTARMVLKYLSAASRELGITVLCNLHQVDLAREFGEQIIGIASGSLVYDGPAANLTAEILRRIYPGPDEASDAEAVDPAITARITNLVPATDGRSS